MSPHILETLQQPSCQELERGPPRCYREQAHLLHDFASPLSSLSFILPEDKVETESPDGNAPYQRHRCRNQRHRPHIFFSQPDKIWITRRSRQSCDFCRLAAGVFGETEFSYPRRCITAARSLPAASGLMSPESLSLPISTRMLTAIRGRLLPAADEMI